MKNKIITLVIVSLISSGSFAEENIKLDKTDCLALLMTVEKNKQYRGESLDNKITRTAAKNAFKKNECQTFFNNVDAVFKEERKIIEQQYNQNNN